MRGEVGTGFVFLREASAESDRGMISSGEGNARRKGGGVREKLRKFVYHIFTPGVRGKRFIDPAREKGISLKKGKRAQAR